MPPGSSPPPASRGKSTFRRLAVPLSFVATVAAGVGIAFLLAAATNDSAPVEPVTRPSPSPSAPTPTSTPTAIPTPAATIRACTPGDVEPSLLLEPAGSDVSVRLSIAGSSACRLEGEMRLQTLLPPTDPQPKVPPFANMRREHSLALTFPYTGLIAEWAWTNWCGDAVALDWVADLGSASAPVQATFFVRDGAPFPACTDASAPTSLRDVLLGDALGGVVVAPRCPAPLDEWLCQFAVFLEQAQAAGDLGPIVRGGHPTTYTCGDGVLPGAESSAVCQGATAGETREGYPLALHGSEGGPLTAAAMVARLESVIGSPLDSPDGVISEAVSVGFPLDTPDGSHFIVALATGDQPAIAYLAFELAPGREPVFIGAGLSGDNANIIARGGITQSVLGEAEFFPLAR